MEELEIRVIYTKWEPYDGDLSSYDVRCRLVDSGSHMYSNTTRVPVNLEDLDTTKQVWRRTKIVFKSRVAFTERIDDTEFTTNIFTVMKDNAKTD